MMATSWGNGKTREENAAVCAAARRQMAEVVAEFVVVGPRGLEDSRHANITAAIDAQRPLGVGAAVVTPDGRLLAYVACQQTAAAAMVAAAVSVRAWLAARAAVQ